MPGSFRAGRGAVHVKIFHELAYTINKSKNKTGFPGVLVKKVTVCHLIRPMVSYLHIYFF